MTAPPNKKTQMGPQHATYTERAVAAILEAVWNEHDFGGWLADVLAQTAAELGSSDALTARRPGSWEAELVQRLLKGTIGWNDEYLSSYAKDDTKTASES